MEQKNILSLGQNNIESTQNQLDLNLLSYQVSHPQQLENQENSSNIMNELENTDITMISEQTLLKKVKSQTRKLVYQNKIFQNAMCQVINQKEDQHVMISYQSEEHKNCIQNISSKYQKIFEKDKNSLQNDFYQQNQCQIKLKQTTINQVPINQSNCQQLKQFEKETDIAIQKDKQEHKIDLAVRTEQTNDLGNDNQQENSERKLIQQDKNSLHNGFSQKDGQIKQNQIKDELILNDNQTNSLQLKYFEEKINIDQQKNKQEHNKQLTLKPEQANDQENEKQQDEYLQQDYYSRNDSSNKEDQIKKNQISNEQHFNNQVDCKSIQEKNDLDFQNDEQQSINVQNLKDKQIYNQENVNLQEKTDRDKIQSQKQDQQIHIQLNTIQQPSQVQQHDILNMENISKQEGQSSQDTTSIPISQNTPIIQQKIQSILSQQTQQVTSKNIEKQHEISQSYSSQLKTKFDEIQAYQFNTDYEKLFEQEQIPLYKKVWEQEIFDRVNKNQSEIFKSQKSKIFERLKNEQFYLCKIVHSNQIEDLILGFFLDEQDNFDEQENLNEYIFKIIYSPVQSDIDLQDQIIKTLGFQLEVIKLEQENISILKFKKNDYLSFSNKFENLVQFKLNIQQIENNYEINSLNYQDCNECNDYKICQNKNCFKNIKYRISAFLKYKKYSYCEYQNKLIEGMIFQLDQDELVLEYLNFVYKTVFSFLENNQIDDKNTCQQQSDYCSEIISQNKQNFSFKEDDEQKSIIDFLI
ncbi:hypothetical protein ABPG73_021832 [Tetrahymena malaccensis]